MTKKQLLEALASSSDDAEIMIGIPAYLDNEIRLSLIAWLASEDSAACKITSVEECGKGCHAQLYIGEVVMG